MAKHPFHLAWFLSQGYGPKSWRSAWPGADIGRWMMPDLFVDLAKGMDRACFDYIIIAASSNVPYTYKGSHDTYLQYAASAPKLDPAVLVPYLAQATKNLGIVPTLSVSEYPPYLMARLVNSLDHVTEGRVGDVACGVRRGERAEILQLAAEPLAQLRPACHEGLVQP